MCKYDQKLLLQLIRTSLLTYLSKESCRSGICKALVLSVDKHRLHVWFEVNEKNAIMEIVLKMNNRIETMTVNFSNLNSSSSSMCPINMQELQDTEDDPSPQNQSPTPDEETSVQETMSMLKEREQRLQVCTNIFCLVYLSQ